jgi:uncharacterized protein
VRAEAPLLRLVGIGLLAGLFSSVFGVGGGLLVVPLLILAAGFLPREATATSLGAIGLTALAGAVAYALRGEVHTSYALLVGLPAAVGALACASLQQRLSGDALRLAFAVLLVVVSGWLLLT